MMEKKYNNSKMNLNDAHNIIYALEVTKWRRKYIMEESNRIMLTVSGTLNNVEEDSQVFSKYN